MTFLNGANQAGGRAAQAFVDPLKAHWDFRD